MKQFGMGKVMPFSLIIFDYDGVLIDSLGDAISVGGEFCRSISHDRLPTKEAIGALDIMTYYELARSVGLSPEQAERFSSHVFERFQAISPTMAFFPEIESLLHRIASKKIAIVSGNAKNVIAAKLAAIDCRYMGMAIAGQTRQREPGFYRD